VILIEGEPLSCYRAIVPAERGPHERFFTHPAR
jgi:hypothetical protein